MSICCDLTGEQHSKKYFPAFWDPQLRGFWRLAPAESRAGRGRARPGRAGAGPCAACAQCAGLGMSRVRAGQGLAGAGPGWTGKKAQVVFFKMHLVSQTKNALGKCTWAPARSTGRPGQGRATAGRAQAGPARPGPGARIPSAGGPKVRKTIFYYVTDRSNRSKSTYCYPVFSQFQPRILTLGFSPRSSPARRRPSPAHP